MKNALASVFVALAILPSFAIAQEMFDPIGLALEQALGGSSEEPGPLATKDGCRGVLATSISFADTGRQYPEYISDISHGVSDERQQALDEVEKAAEAIAAARQKMSDALFTLCATYP